MISHTDIENDFYINRWIKDNYVYIQNRTLPSFKEKLVMATGA